MDAEVAALARAAAKIANADFILVAAGAGFSADSGLPVYNDIASVEVYKQQGLEYHDLCDPYWLEQDEQVFYGFWGNCFDAYRDTNPHAGYSILKKWKERLATKQGAFQKTFELLRLQQQSIPTEVTLSSFTNDPFFIYTSNVDAHFHREFAVQEIYELHGSLEKWQCAGGPSVDGRSSTQHGRRPCEETWTLPSRSTRFHVDPQTMRVDSSAVGNCRQCNGQSRPNVLMFHDQNWIANVEDENRYVAWEAVMEQMLEDDPSLKLVVLEIGCGMRVPSVRRETEMVVADAFARCEAKHHQRGPSAANANEDPQVALIRINPDFPECDHPLLLHHDLVVSIGSTALAALTEIDRLLSAHDGNRTK